MAWSAARVSADFYNSVQKEAGTLLKNFDVTNPKAPLDEDIITETMGGITISIVPETQDVFENIDNMPNNTAEGKEITGWNVTLSTTAVKVTEDVIALALGASEVGLNSGISPRRTYELTDFKPIYWIGDFANKTKLLVVKIDNAISTSGLRLKTEKNGKGQLSLEFTGHTKLNEQDKIPAEIYVLTKVEDDE